MKIEKNKSEKTETVHKESTTKKKTERNNKKVEKRRSTNKKDRGTQSSTHLYILYCNGLKYSVLDKDSDMNAVRNARS